MATSTNGTICETLVPLFLGITGPDFKLPLSFLSFYGQPYHDTRPPLGYEVARVRNTTENMAEEVVYGKEDEDATRSLGVVSLSVIPSHDDSSVGSLQEEELLFNVELTCLRSHGR